ncbi:MAG: outer membrane lipoprotein LolB [Candidatus Competibacteraceae bacterium]|nr:outer membrane lipoprotein LolB [Candidatus Competibacteraceae bacterium]
MPAYFNRFYSLCSTSPARRAAGRIAPLALMAWLAGCAVLPAPTADSQNAWTARQQELMRLTRWQAAGRIGVVNGQDGWHANFQWAQREQDYRIDLIGPLGQGRVLIEGDDRQVSIQTQDGQSQTASDPDSLLEQAIGVRLPVEGLRYWIRGVPEPGPVAASQTDRNGRLLRLEQQGWIIEYPDYAPASPTLLPARIVARRQDLSVKLVIDRWTL